MSLNNLRRIGSCIIITSLMIITFNGCRQQVGITQWRGPSRNGFYPDVNLLAEWPEGGPEVVLQIDSIGEGHSSALVHNNIIYTSGLKDTMDFVFAFNMKGKLLWEKAFGTAWRGTHPETRNTPTLEGNKLFIASGSGEVVCMDARSGRIIWKKDPIKEFRGKFSVWGPAESLLLTDNAVIYAVGGEDASVIAMNKETGELIWKSPSTGGVKAYCTPVLIDRNGTQVILVELQQELLGINPLNGEILWNFDLRPVEESRVSWLNHTNPPLYKNGGIFITRGYDMDGLMLSLSEDGHNVNLKWKNPALDTHLGGVVEVNGFIYGSSWITNTSGNWICLDWNTGKVMYEQEWYNKGEVIYADGHLYCIEEKDGNTALVLPDPSGFKIVSTFRVKEGIGPYWSHPAIYDGKLFIRHGDVLMVYDISNKSRK
jgi:outer membrane protein assembly factor BamB